LAVPITRLVDHGAYLENLSEIGGTHHKAGRLRAYLENLLTFEVHITRQAGRLKAMKDRPTTQSFSYLKICHIRI
jgi:hypothetical protein